MTLEENGDPVVKSYVSNSNFGGKTFSVMFIHNCNYTL